MGTAIKIDPFKIAKSRKKKQTRLETIDSPDWLTESIDRWNELNAEIKHLEGQASVERTAIQSYADLESSRRVLNGQPSNFKLKGLNEDVTYILSDRVSQLSQDEIDQLTAKYGPVIGELIETDLGSLRFDPDVLRANFAAVEAALSTLPEEVLSNLFQPAMGRAKKGILKQLKQLAKDEDQLNELVSDLKLTRFIRA